MNTVTGRALYQRINRKLAHEAERLCAARPGTREYAELGPYYVVSNQTSAVVAWHCDLAKLWRELGVMAEQEQLQEEAA